MNEDSPSNGLAVPQRRLARLSRMGGLAGGIAGRVALSGAGEIARGRRPRARDLLLTPANVTRLTEELSRMRGAAMKLGQLMSMETADVLPPDLAAILARLRSDAHVMPPKQLKSVLTDAWGDDFLRRFARFGVRPVAAASIGQVHRAITRDGRDLAVKVQYPGVRASIDSDLANVAALIRMSGLLPRGIAMGPLLDEARRQLHEEADYRREARYLDRFGALLRDDPDFVVPALHADLTTDTVLAMDYVEAEPVDALARRPQAERDRVAARLIALVLREVFAFGLMQSDPNFANYRYRPEDGRLVLLDFGASREIAPAMSASLRRLLGAALDGDGEGLEAGLGEAGILVPDMPPAERATILGMARTAMEPLGRGTPFDFAADPLAARLREAGLEMGLDGLVSHMPPLEMLFLQRKIGGMYLLAARLGAQVDLRAALELWR